MTETSDDKYVYIVNPEESAEKERLSLQDTLMTESMGGVIPEEVASGLEHVVDIGCGPGAWVLSYAQQYPETEVIGVDVSKNMLDYARAQAKILQLSNVSFEEMDARYLQLEKAAYDLVNIRTLSAAITPSQWPNVLHHAFQALRPGGLIRWSESDIPQTSSHAYEKIWFLLAQAMRKREQVFSQSGYTLGMQPHMEPLLQKAGFHVFDEESVSQVYKTQVHIIDVSHGKKAWLTAAQITLTFLEVVKPTLFETGVVEKEQYEALIRQVVNDIEQPDFRCLTFLYSIWGRKP